MQENRKLGGFLRTDIQINWTNSTIELQAAPNNDNDGGRLSLLAEINSINYSSSYKAGKYIHIIKCEIGLVNVISLTILVVSIASGLAESNIPHVNASIINKLYLDIQLKSYGRKIFFIAHRDFIILLTMRKKINMYVPIVTRCM